MRTFLLTTFEPRMLFTWPVFGISLVWAITTNFLDVDNNPPGNELPRLASVVAAHCAFFVGIGVFVLASRFLNRIVAAGAMVPAVVLLSMFRGFVLFELLFAIGHDAPELLGYRVGGSITNVALSTLVSAVVLHKVRTYGATRRELLAERTRLRDVRDHAREEMAKVSQHTVDDIRATITGALRPGESSTPEDTALQIDHIIEDVVRPISHRLDQEVFAWAPRDHESHPAPLDWRRVLQSSLSAPHIHPAGVALALSVMATATATRNHSVVEALYIIGVALGVTWGGLLVVRKFVSSVKKPWATRFGVLAGALAVGGLSGSATVLVKLDTERPFSLLVQSPLYTLAFTVLFALAGSATREAEKATERLRRTTEGLAWEVARISEEYRFARKSLSRALHGKVQAGMMSSLIRLRNAMRDNAPGIDQIATQTRLELEDLLESLGNPQPEEPMTLDGVLSDLADTWDGVASCEVVVSPATRASLEADPIVLASLCELIPELAFNAIKHGRATTVSFVIEVHDERTLRMACHDNGSRPSDSGRVGLGTKLLDECALSWTRTTEGARTTTELLLPFSPGTLTR